LKLEEFIGDVLKRISKKNGFLKKALNLSNLREEWDKVCPELFLKKTYVKDYNSKEKLIVIECENNIIMQEIFFQKDLLIKKINDYFDDEILKEVRVIRGEKNG
jgi:hypothetical protein